MHSHSLRTSLLQPSVPSSRAREVSSFPHQGVRACSNCLYGLEVYRFLSSEVKAYLPSYETVTVWHLRDLAMGVKRIIYSDKVKLI